jgi:hypothetical protein
LPAPPVGGATAAEASTPFAVDPQLVAPPPVLPAVPGFDVQGILGRGGMGVVYLARQQGLNRLVALKMILTGGHAGVQERQRFRLEAEAVARLRHPGIVQVHQVGEHAGLPFLVLEYVAGGPLSRVLAGQPQSPAQTVTWLLALAEAVQEAHAAGVVHRDLKPANVLLDANGAPKITDFGLAKYLEGPPQDGPTASGAVLGTPSYTAPEQAEGRTRELGPPCDVWALGAVLYECLTGRPPFRADTPFNTLRQVIQAEAVAPRLLNPAVPRDLETICLKCLQKNPASRYSSARELAEDLGRFQRGEPIRARPVGVTERAWRWTRRNPTVASLIAAVTAALLLGLGVSLFYAGQATQEAALKQAEADRARQAAHKARRDRYLAQIDIETAWTLGEIRLIDIETGALTSWWKGTSANRLAVSPDGRHVATVGTVVTVHRLPDGERVVELPPGRSPPHKVAFLHDGRLAVGRYDGTIDLHSLPGGAVETTLVSKHVRVHGLWAVEGGRRLVSQTEDGTLTFWDLDTNEAVRVVRGEWGATPAAFDPAGRWAFRVRGDTCGVWDLRPLDDTAIIRGEAVALVDHLAGQCVDRVDLLRRVRESPALSGPVRAEAEALAGRYEDDSEALAWQAFDRAVIPGRLAEDYAGQLPRADRAARDLPGDPLPLLARGTVELRLGKLDEAHASLQAAEHVYDRRPGLPRVWLWRLQGITAARSNRREEARALADRARAFPVTAEGGQRGMDLGGELHRLLNPE